MTANTDKKFYTVEQFINYIGDGTISASSVYRHMKNGEIPHTQIGNRKLIPAHWVHALCGSALGEVG